MSYVVIARKRSWDKDEPIVEYPTEPRAIRCAEHLFYRKGCDTVAVVTVNPDTKKYEIPLKITRKCKHVNVQFALNVQLNTMKQICVDCNDTIEPIIIDEQVTHEAVEEEV